MQSSGAQHVHVANLHPRGVILRVSVTFISRLLGLPPRDSILTPKPCFYVLFPPAFRDSSRVFPVLFVLTVSCSLNLGGQGAGHNQVASGRGTPHVRPMSWSSQQTLRHRLFLVAGSEHCHLLMMLCCMTTPCLDSLSPTGRLVDTDQAGVGLCKVCIASAKSFGAASPLPEAMGGWVDSR